jgi:hypothetical protein
VFVKKVVDFDREFGFYTSNIMVQSELGMNEYVRGKSFSRVTRDVPTARVSGMDRECRRAGGQGRVCFQLIPRDITEGLVVRRRFWVGAIPGVGDGVGKSAVEKNLSRKHSARLGGEFAPEGPNSADVFWGPIALAGRLPDNLIPATLREGSHFDL